MASFDVVGSIDVLEHLEHLEESMAEIARVLKGGGTFWGTCAFWQQEHDSYFHMTHRGLRALLSRHGFDVLSLEPSRGSGFVLVSQRLFGGDGQVRFHSVPALIRSSILCGASVLPFAIVNGLEVLRRFAGSAPLKDCGSLLFIARSREE